MATPFFNVLTSSAQAHRIAAVPRCPVIRQPAVKVRQTFHSDHPEVLATHPAVFQPRPGYLTRAARWLAESVVTGFAAYGAAHIGVPLERFQDIEPPV